jgi:Family of unknown function (DUF6506)
MADFNEAFIFLAEGADPAARTVRETEFTHTEIVPVPDAETAAAIAAEMHADRGLDLVELYGGFGATAAAAVIEATGGEVPVGLAGAEEDAGVRDRAAIFAAWGADPAKDRHVHEYNGGRITFVAVSSPEQVPAVAGELVDTGAERIEICGGLGTLPSAATIEAVGDRTTVRSIMFGFESLPSVAGYRARFEEAVAAKSRTAANPSPGA